MELVGKLKRLSLFRTFTEDYLKKVLQENSYMLAKFEKGGIIFNEGEICRHIHVILEGTVIIEKIDISGRYFLVGEAVQGDMMGPNVLFSRNSIYPLSTRAKDYVEIFMIPKDFMLKLCQDNREFLEELLMITSSKAFMLTKRLNEVTVQTVRQNIARYLLEETEKSGSSEVVLTMTKKQWAETLGVQRPSLSRELKNLADQGVISMDRDRITVLDPDTLSEMI